jgi:hypothetical protein
MVGDGFAKLWLVSIATPGIRAGFDVAFGEFGNVQYGRVARLLEHNAQLDAPFGAGVPEDDGVKWRAIDAVAVKVDIQNADFHNVFPSKSGRALRPAPLRCGLVFLFGGETERQAPVKGHGIQLDIDALVVPVQPGCPDAGRVGGKEIAQVLPAFPNQGVQPVEEPGLAGNLTPQEVAQEKGAYETVLGKYDSRNRQEHGREQGRQQERE